MFYDLEKICITVMYEMEHERVEWRQTTKLREVTFKKVVKPFSSRSTRNRALSFGKSNFTDKGGVNERFSQLKQKRAAICARHL